MDIKDFCFIMERSSCVSNVLFVKVMKKNTYNLYYSPPPLFILKKIFYKYFFWKRKGKSDKYNNKIVIMTNESLTNISPKLLNDIKSKSKAVVLFLIDELFNNYISMQTVKKLLSEDQNYFDLIYTFSEKDALVNNIRFNDFCYSAYNVKSLPTHSNLFFIGNLKNRSQILNSVYDYFTSLQLSCDFIVNGVPKNMRVRNFDYNFINYKKSISHLLSTNCILDIVDERQTGMTLRYYEAVVYNKKLLTNNANVVNMTYYNSEYMKVYKTVEDIKKIPLSWFSDDKNIDYGYKGDFEPINFLVRIKEDLSNSYEKSIKKNS